MKPHLCGFAAAVTLIGLMGVAWAAPGDQALPTARGQAGPWDNDVFRSVFIRVPSSAGGKEGIAASVLVPRQPRYANGAPVVIQVAGGVQAGNARGRPEYAGHGLVEIHFAFPGGGRGAERSGGDYDFRGPNCVRALADVIRFATGRTGDLEGRSLAMVADGLKVLTNNVGLVGSSHGGNACGVALAKYGDEFPDLAWYASMESPYGEGAANVELGGHESGVNPAYDAKTGTLDWSRLAWSSGLAPGLFRKAMPVSTRELRGAFYGIRNAVRPAVPARRLVPGQSRRKDLDAHQPRGRRRALRAAAGDLHAGGRLRAGGSDPGPRLVAEPERGALSQRPLGALQYSLSFLIPGSGTGYLPSEPSWSGAGPSGVS